MRFEHAAPRGPSHCLCWIVVQFTSPSETDCRSLDTSEVATESSGKRGRIAASFSCCHRDEPNLPVPTTPRQHGYGREPTGALRAMRKSHNSRHQRFSSRDCAHRRWGCQGLSLHCVLCLLFCKDRRACDRGVLLGTLFPRILEIAFATGSMVFCW